MRTLAEITALPSGSLISFEECMLLMVFEGKDQSGTFDHWGKTYTVRMSEDEVEMFKAAWPMPKGR